MKSIWWDLTIEPYHFLIDKRSCLWSFFFQCNLHFLSLGWSAIKLLIISKYFWALWRYLNHQDLWVSHFLTLLSSLCTLERYLKLIRSYWELPVNLLWARHELFKSELEAIKSCWELIANYCCSLLILTWIADRMSAHEFSRGNWNWLRAVGAMISLLSGSIVSSLEA